jgi:hypothetical protein
MPLRFDVVGKSSITETSQSETMKTPLLDDAHRP